MHSSFPRASSVGQPSRPEQKIPGPPGLPWLGQLPAFLRSRFFPKQMLKWAEEYNGVYRMEIVGRRYLVVSDPDLLPPIMGRGGPGLPKSDGYGMWDPVISPHPGVQGIVTVSETTDVWRAVRRSYGPAMGLGSLGGHYPAILRCAAALGDYMEAAGTAGAKCTARRAATDTEAGSSPPSALSPPLEMDRLLKALSLDMLGRCAFGVDFGAIRNPEHVPLAHYLERAMAEAGARARNPGRRLLPWLYDEERREGEAAMAAFHEAVEDIWRQIRSRGPPKEYDTDMAAQLLRLADPARGPDAVSDEQICAEIATVILAGYETTANTLTWMLFALNAHPEAASKLEEELRGAGLIPLLGDDDLSSPDEDDSEDPSLAAFLALPGGHQALSSLPYLDAFVRECLRMFSVAPNGAVKTVPVGSPPAHIGPYKVEPGTTVWVPFWSLHLSERNWEQPLEFQPERWMNLNPRTGFDTSSSSSIGLPGSDDTSATAVTTSRCPVAAAVGTLRAVAATAVAAATENGGVHHHHEQTSNNSSCSNINSGSSRNSSSRATRYMPFSEGSRNCVGQHLGMLQVKVVLSYLFSRFRFRLDQQRMGGVEGALERQRVNLTLEVEGGMWMVAEPRRPRQGQWQEHRGKAAAINAAAAAS